ncbi:pimeloyl-ACP methyl ester carboxylesterase [Mycolicibacterium sp. BK634]|uniref:alpha/beta fold hydrolase n=1 Tax=Mycobacteriaceae TaxID=1762 RepID=UPI00105D1C76|nr:MULTISPECIES: alpha/beta hydrolase [Mycobacteriaceae]MBB3754434.1 pimeloyl-ACP methyl ester carboxylesterase [Mycolicibacterium sp. BK634]TDO16900.1 pimeloyl-ACP methyl ester carboxylesterase [Mycobacterium sp. BK086]
MLGPGEKLTLRLSDGRSVSYAQYGAADGAVVVNAHGGLACRLDVAAADNAARAAGIRLLSPDRPGIGDSDPQPGRTILDWTRDVAGMLDQLGVEHFSAMGWSMGGQYAAALAWALPERVKRVAIIAGALPLTEPGVFAQLPAFDRIYTRLSQRAPWLVKPCFAAMALTSRTAPGLYGRFAAGQLGSADAAVVRGEGDEFARMSAEALRRPSGVVEDYRAWMRPWGFAPEQITVPVDVWGGQQDELVNIAWPRELARRIPGATLQERPGGHFLAHLYYPDIFARLA